VNIWPPLNLPKIDIDLPELEILTSTGLVKIDEKASFTSFVCGITPYDATHLGHAATYLTFDLIHRYLVASGVDLNFVENITDIDDPLFERALRDNQSWSELADSQIALFTSDMSALRIIPPKSYISVTETITDIIDAINRLVESGDTYKIEGDTYFKVDKFLGGLTIPYERALVIFAERGGDPKRVGKESPLDPILWIANKPGEPSWQSPMGLGRPGWHIECSVIALKYLVGDNYLDNSSTRDFEIDLQGGGSDLIFPHHFMTAAIGKALTHKDFAKSYIHTGMVGLDGEKMSKSKGNLVLVSKLLDSGFDAMEIRHALLSQHFASDRMWSSQTILESRERIASLRKSLSKVDVAPTAELLGFLALDIADNLNTPNALKRLDEWSESTQSGATGGSAGELSRFLDAIFGLTL
jgi:L-cysteine:1D-myo-inositol 2-amino-2-deoxy-alpha-D-glucopyranoside ligase